MSYQEGINKDQTVSTTLDLPNAVQDLVVTLSIDERFRTFSRMVESSALAEIWKGSDWTTLLVPTDEAFGRLSEKSRSQIQDPRNADEVRKFLESHALRGYFKEADLRAARNIKTLGGLSIRVTNEDGRTRVNDARLVSVDIPCNNGIIHALDAALTGA
jgi:uncharacterized surface protein with fasciclin (FAS1) repeats